MTTDILDTKELFADLNRTTGELLKLISSANESTLNTVPFKDSWTAAQLASHITKSNKAITQALNMKGEPAGRNPDARTGELKAMFLDFSIKFQSPEFIVPAEGSYQKEKLVDDLKRSIEHLEETGNKANLAEIISLPAFGEITKLELLYFVSYHTQRHIHQLKNILRFAHKN
jgi:hypothetical protein